MLTWAKLRIATQLHVKECGDCRLYWHKGMFAGDVSLCEAGIGIQYSYTMAGAR